MAVTTTMKGFRVEDITFRHARMQDEIKNEIDIPDNKEVEIKPPVSLTPEQVKDFYKTKISLSQDSNEKRVYSQTIKWIDSMLSLRKRVLEYELKEEALRQEEIDNGIESDEDIEV